MRINPNKKSQKLQLINKFKTSNLCAKWKGVLMTAKIDNKSRASLKSENINMLIVLQSNKNHRFNDCENEAK